MSRTVPVVASILLELLLTACLPVTTSSPLGTTVAAAPDPRLNGMWTGKLGTSPGPAYIVFYPAHGGSRKIVALAPPTGDDDGGWIVLEARPSTLGGNTYLDAREVDDDGKAADPRLAHVPILYRVADDGSLALYLIDESSARKAIGKGAIAGTVEPGQFGDVAITAAPAALDRFFGSRAGRALFTTPIGIFRRVN